MKRLAFFCLALIFGVATFVPADAQSVRSGGGVSRDHNGTSDDSTFAGTGISWTTTDDWSVFTIVKMDTNASAIFLQIAIVDSGLRFQTNSSSVLQFLKDNVVSISSSGLTLSTSSWMALGVACNQDVDCTFWVIRYDNETTAQESVVANTQAFGADGSKTFRLGSGATSLWLNGKMHRLAFWRGAGGGGVITKTNFEDLSFGRIQPRDVSGPTLQRDYILDGASAPVNREGTSDDLVLDGTTIADGPGYFRLHWSRRGASGSRRERPRDARRQHAWRRKRFSGASSSSGASSHARGSFTSAEVRS